MNHRKLSLALFLTYTISSMTLMAQASDLSPDSVESAVRKAQVIQKDYPVKAVISGREATILTRRHPKATDDDLRIDSVLITKSVLDAFGTSIGTVKVLFRDEDSSNGKRVEVTANDIKTYANGSIDPRKFLSTIAVSKIGGDLQASEDKLNAEERKMAVSPGLYEEQRLLLMDRINTLRRKGTGVAPFEAMFAQIDSLAKSGQTPALKESIQTLGEKLAEQEDLVRQANRTGSGRGITFVSNGKTKAVTGSSAAPSSSIASTSAGPMVSDQDVINGLQIKHLRNEVVRLNMGSSFSDYYNRKLNDIISERQKGSSSDQIKESIADLQAEIERKTGRETPPLFRRGFGRGFQQQGWTGNGGPGNNNGLEPSDQRPTPD